jgi:hypothetical protein
MNHTGWKTKNRGNLSSAAHEKANVAYVAQSAGAEQPKL